jgi:hypothetical protein
MLSIGHVLSLAQKFTTDNSPAILTSIGVAGTLATAVLSAKAGVRAADILREAEVKRSTDVYGTPINVDPFTKKEKFKLIWRELIPPVATVAMTVTCIIAANRIGTRRTAAMAAAYTVAEKTLVEYQDKVRETIGANKAKKVEDDIAQDRINRHPISQAHITNTGRGNVDYFDVKTGRYFKSDQAAVDAAVNRIQHLQNTQGHASLNDFYNALGLATIPDGEDFGWNGDKLMELQRNTSVTVRLQPLRGYDGAFS